MLPFWALAALAVVSGCVFDDLQRSETKDVQRIEQKEVTLQAEQDKSVKLKQQEDQLMAELFERQVSLSELNQRVAQLQAANGLAVADNESRRLEFNDLIGRLHETNQQLAALQQGNEAPIEQRRERIDYLKAQLKAQLQLLLH